MANSNGYWIKVNAYDNDENLEASGKIFLLHYGRSKEQFLQMEVYDRGCYDVDWSKLRKTQRNGIKLAERCPSRNWGGGMSWEHDIVEGCEPSNIGADTAYGRDWNKYLDECAEEAA